MLGSKTESRFKFGKRAILCSTRSNAIASRKTFDQGQLLDCTDFAYNASHSIIEFHTAELQPLHTM